MQFYSIFLTAADNSHIGRVDKASLSTQTLMEIFISGIENKEVICGSAEEPEDIDQWTGFSYSQEQPADAAEKHLNINWYKRHLVGTIDLQWLPTTIFSVTIYDSKLSGSLNLAVLAPSIRFLNLGGNDFSGEIDLHHMPAEIEEITLSDNQLTGSLNLEELARSIQALYLRKNHFSGTVCLRHLPPSIVELSISENELSGSVNLTRLPVTLKFLCLHRNNFGGRTDFSRLPKDLNVLNISCTNLAGEISVRNRTTRFLVGHSNVELVE